MKRGLLILVSVLLLWGCDSNISDDNTKFQNMKHPIIVIAISPQDLTSDPLKYGSITLRDSNGTVASFSGRYILGGSLVDSYNMGDTIK